MSKRPEITKELSMSLEKYINPKNDTRIYMAKEVTFDYATGHAIRVDYMKFKPVNNTVSGIEKRGFLLLWSKIFYWRLQFRTRFELYRRLQLSCDARRSLYGGFK